MALRRRAALFSERPKSVKSAKLHRRPELPASGLKFLQIMVVWTTLVKFSAVTVRQLSPSPSIGRLTRKVNSVVTKLVRIR